MKSKSLGCKRLSILLVVSLTLLLSLALVLSALSNRTLPTESSVVDELSPVDLARVKEFKQLQQAVGDAVWPGFASAEFPLLLYNESFAFLVSDDRPTATGWTSVSGGSESSGEWQAIRVDASDKSVYYRLDLAQASLEPEAFVVRVGDELVSSLGTMEWMRISLVDTVRQELPPFLRLVFPYRLFVGLLVSSSDHYIALMAHESFHAFQGMVAAERLARAEHSTVSEEHYPWNDERLQSDWQVELDLLTEALGSQDRTQRIELTREFLVHRERRRTAAAMTSTAVDYERQREWLEGLAKYVELEFWRQASILPNYTPSPEIRLDPEFDEYEGFEGQWSREVGQIGRLATDRGDGRFYYSGMAQAVLLDTLLSDWKEQALVPDVFLEDLLAEAVAE